MKKLRIIITSVIVLAIVGGAFAFKINKAGEFCVLDINASGTNCTTYLLNRAIVSGMENYKYYPGYLGDRAACTAANNQLCTATVRLSGPQ